MKIKNLFIAFGIILSFIAFAAVTVLGSNYLASEGTLYILDGRDVPDFFYGDLGSNYTKVAYVLAASDSGNEIVMPDTNVTSADELIGSDDNIHIVAYYDSENEKTIPYIRMASGKFIGRNFAVQKNERYLIWNDEEMNLTFDLQ